MVIDHQDDLLENALQDNKRKHHHYLAQAVSKLREDIASGNLEAGYRLKEVELAKTYQVTRGAIREALTILEGEGLIQRLPNRGFAIFDVSLADAQEIYEAREIMEGFASRLFTQRATEPQKNALRRAIDEFAAEAIKVPLQQKELLNKRNAVYEVLHQGCGNSILYNTLKSLRDRISYLRKQTLASRSEYSLRELHHLFDAIMEGNAEKAERTAKTHIQNAAKLVYATLKQSEQTPRRRKW